MKRYLIILCILMASSNLLGLRNHYSQTSMLTRPAYFNIEAYQAFWHDAAFGNENQPSAIQCVAYYQKSNSDKCKDRSRELSQYFLMAGRSQLSVKGDDFIDEHNRDIRAEWLTLPDNFKGTFSLFPQQTQTAFQIDLKHELRTHFDTPYLENVWIGISTAFVSVQNRLNLEQDIVSTTSGKTIIGSLNRSDIAFNKFYEKNCSTGLSEIRFKLGSQFLSRNGYEVFYHSYVLFPLSSNKDAQKFFQAVRGFNSHVGVGAVANFQIRLNDRTCDDSIFAFCFDIENVYLCRDSECRTMDLFGKPWSRYLLLNKTDGTTNIPAINVLTQRVEVHPYNVMDLSTGFRYKSGGFEAEITYGLWAHGHEVIRLKNSCFCPEEEQLTCYGIAAKPGEFTPCGLPATASNSTIACLANTDKDINGNNAFVPISVRDLDLQSAAAQGALAHRANGAIGYTKYGECYNVFVGIGGFAEISQNNTALSQFGVWGKIGAAF